MYVMCENLQYESVYFKELYYTKTKAAIDRQHTERGQMKCQLLLVKGVHSVRRTALSEALKKLY